MTQEDQFTQVQADVNALKRQMRQLLEVMAAVQEQATASREAQRPSSTRSESSAPPFESMEQTPLPAAYQRRSALASSTHSAESRSSDATLGPIYAENARLVDLVRAQAEELGTLRERVRRLEDARRQDREPVAITLRALLHALREEA